MKDAGADTVITSCPACDMMWRQVYPEWAKKLGIDYDIKAKHYSEVVAEKIAVRRVQVPRRTAISPCTVTWHDSCHIGRVSGVYEPPRELIKAIPDVNLVEMEHNREEAHCCGSVLTLIKDPPVAAEIGKTRLDEAVEAGAEKVLALCPCCEFQLRVSADKKKMPDRGRRPGPLRRRRAGLRVPRPQSRGAEAVGGLRGDDRSDDAAGLRRPDGHHVAGADRRHALRHGHDDAGDGQGARAR